MVDDFNASISFDSRLYKQDIQGSIAHALMLAKQGIISPEEGELIVTGTAVHQRDLEAGQLNSR
jgi:argininosuccinate lyase